VPLVLLQHVHYTQHGSVAVTVSVTITTTIITVVIILGWGEINTQHG
jgi:hypothetical protein